MSRASKEYKTYQRIISRCHDENHERYPYYGARGIRVCDEWREPKTGYVAFLAYVGRAPTAAHTIGRKDNDKGYEPGNVRWETWAEQAQNRRNTVRMTNARGVTRTQSQWAEKLKIDRRILWKRINLLGWTEARAISTPVARRTKRAPEGSAAPEGVVHQLKEGRVA